MLSIWYLNCSLFWTSAINYWSLFVFCDNSSARLQVAVVQVPLTKGDGGVSACELKQAEQFQDLTSAF